MRAYTVDELEEMETITEGHSQDLKVDGDVYRVWLSRVHNDVEYEGPSGYQYLNVMIDVD